MAGESKTMTGPRGQLIIGDRVVGQFTSVSWGMAYDAVPINILGRFSPAEIVYTGQEAISINTNGWKIIDSGPHVAGKMPALQDLLSSPYLEIAIVDRQTGKRVARFHDVRCVSNSGSLHSKAPSEMTLNFMATRMSDETVTNVERADASDLP